MNFISTQFVIFMLVTWGLFLVLPPRYRWHMLLAASYVFYATWSIPFVAVILLTTSVDYLASKIIFANASPKFRKMTLWTAIAVNLLVLGYFKYFNFFLDINASLMKYLGVANTMPKHLEILLPLGISYYTFEAISYLVDVYRGAKPAPNWLSYNFYIMYFPHLISGPIIRFNELWPQYKEGIQTPEFARVGKGLELLVLGYMFKLIIADNCAGIADPVFAKPESASVLATYTAVLAFAGQLYFDFLGYTHIARGASLMFNLELPINFKHPLNADNMADFWQRWQISLSRWLHDYLYVPLGGSRKFLPRTMLNVFITLMVAGIWHGAGWIYVILGLYFGLNVAGYHAWRRLRKKLFKSKDKVITHHPLYVSVAHVITFTLIVLSGVFFRSTSVQTEVVIFDHLIRFKKLFEQIAEAAARDSFTEIGICFSMIVILISGPYVVRLYERLYQPMPYWVKLQTATAALLLCWIFCAEYIPPFIYFQF